MILGQQLICTDCQRFKEKMRFLTLTLTQHGNTHIMAAGSWMLY